MKKCTHCKQIKSKAVFPKNKVTKDGFHNECKECTKRYWRDPEKQKIRKLYIKKYKEDHYFHYWAQETLRSHKRHGHIINVSVIDVEELISNSKECYLCGKFLDWGFRKGTIKPNSPTIDRVDNEMFLNKDNIKICHYKCNITKQDRTLKEFIEFCKTIVDKHCRK